MQYNQCQGQTRKLLPIDFSGASETSLKVYVYKQKSINSGKNNNRTEYWYVVEGVPRNTYQIEWTRETLDGTGRIKKENICILVPKGRSGKQLHSSADDFGSLSLERVIKPITIHMPGKSEIKPMVIDPEGGLLFKGDSIRMQLDLPPNYDPLTWVWQPKDDPKGRQEGKYINVQDIDETSYAVFARFSGCDGRTVYSDTITMPIQVKDRNDLEFRINGPIQSIDDTSNFSMTIDVLKDRLGESLSWKWFKVDKQSIRLVGTEKYYSEIAAPILVDTLYRACAYARGREVKCKNYKLRINKLPGPGAYTIQQFDTVMCSGQIRVVGKAKGFKPQKWTWLVNGEAVDNTSDTLLVSDPWIGKLVCGYPTLNRRGGIRDSSCIILKGCMNQTSPIVSVAGPDSICTDDPVSVYHIKWASSSDRNRSWLFYENNTLIRTLRPGSDTIQLIPLQSNTYKIQSPEDSSRSFKFHVFVAQRPAPPDIIAGPDSVCQFERFTLFAEKKNPDAVKWQWYKKSLDAADAKQVFVGEGKTLSDSLSESSIYHVYGDRMGCRSRSYTIKSVGIKAQPVAPVIKLVRYKRRAGRISIEMTGARSSKDTYEWSNDGFQTISGVGSILKDIPFDRSPLRLQVRIRDACNLFSNISEILIERSQEKLATYIIVRIITYRINIRKGVFEDPRVVIVPERTIRVEPEREGDVFFNVGVITNLPLSFQNFRLTGGFGKMYVSAVLNPFYLFGGAGHVKTYDGTMLEINGAGRVVNFPSSTGNYYTVNESVISSRIGLTVGALFNLRYLNLNAGAGYGTRDLFRGIDMRSYSTNNLQSKVWAKSIENRWRGLSVEAGICKSFHRINVMMGVHAIIDPDRKMPFVEMSMGLGVPFNRK